MRGENDIVRLINCLAGSFILHAFILSFSQQSFWNPAGSSRYSANPALHETLTVRLIPKEPLPAITLQPVQAQDMRNHPPTMQQVAEMSSVRILSSAKPSAPVYHTGKELSRLPEMMERPPAAIEIDQGTSGEVVFKLSIDRFGKVALVQRLKSNLPRETEGKLAMQLYRAQYRPGEIGGLPVDSEMIVDLKLESGEWLTDRLPVLRPAKSRGSP
jgi:hypothetical protein